MKPEASALAMEGPEPGWVLNRSCSLESSLRAQTDPPPLLPLHPPPEPPLLYRERWALTWFLMLVFLECLTQPSLFSPEVDIEGMEFGPGELDSVGSSSDADDHYSLQSGGCSDGGYGRPCRRPGRPSLS